MLVILSHGRKSARSDLLPQPLEWSGQVLPWTNKSEATESTYPLRGFSCLLEISPCFPTQGSPKISCNPGLLQPEKSAGLQGWLKDICFSSLLPSHPPAHAVPLMDRFLGVET